MEEDQQLLFICKFCNKKFPCGKSLGGHIKSHMKTNSSESDEKFEPNFKKFPSFKGENTLKDEKIDEFLNGQSSYALRENPRRTWKTADLNSNSSMSQERVCQQCGKVFQSQKALCGHMACHSEKDKNMKDDSSWTSDSDTEIEDMVMRTRSSSAKELKKVISNGSSLACYGSSSVSDIDVGEPEELAKCLMMLSRDFRSYKGESSDNNSVVLETISSSIETKKKREAENIEKHQEEQIRLIRKNADLETEDSDEENSDMESSDSGYFLDECHNAESEVSFDGFQRKSSFSNYESSNRSKDQQYQHAALASYFAGIDSRKKQVAENHNTEPCDDSPKRSKYECFNCKKTFKSYQALGGHRPCHKKTNAYHESRHETSENSLEDSMELTNTNNRIESSSSKGKSSAKFLSEKNNKGKKNNKGHVCPFCDRVFKNGQALGGHKRSHFHGGNNEGNTSQVKETNNKPELLDLNLPAPEEDDDEDNGQFT